MKTTAFVLALLLLASKNLHQFFQQWIYGEKYPAYTYSWSTVLDKDAGYLVTISLAQVGNDQEKRAHSEMNELQEFENDVWSSGRE